MPGRGRYWKIGGINDEHIIETDLDQALQTKVNTGGGGGGNTEVLLDSVVPSSLTSHSFALSRSVAMDGSDVAKLIVLIQNLQVSGTDNIAIQFNSAGASGDTRGIHSDGTTVTAFTDGSDINSISDFSNTSTGYVELEIEGDTDLGTGEGFIRSSTQGAGRSFGSGSVTLTTNAFDPITSVQILTKGASVTINNPTRVIVLAINKD